MPTRNISLTAEQDAFGESVVKAGEYQNTSETVHDALRALQQRRREDALKLEALRIHVQAGIDALERVDCIEIDDSSLDDYLDGLIVTHDKGTVYWRSSKLAFRSETRRSWGRSECTGI